MSKEEVLREYMGWWWWDVARRNLDWNGYYPVVDDRGTLCDIIPVDQPEKAERAGYTFDQTKQRYCATTRNRPAGFETDAGPGDT